ncbi:hypothetical protein NMG60_11005337 [Bertholletia excelsa]
MSVEMQSKNGYTRSAGDIKRRSRTAETSKFVMHSIPSSPGTQNLKFLDKQTVDSRFSQPCLNQHRELRPSACNEPIFQPKSLRNSQTKTSYRSKQNKDDELFNCKSNLPCYIQKEQKVEILEQNARDFVVLDYMEKWKCKKNGTPPKSNTNALSPSRSYSFRGREFSTNKTLAPHRNPHPATCAHINSYQEAKCSLDAKHSQGEAIHQDFEITRMTMLNRKQEPHQTDEFSGENYSDIQLERGKRKDADQNITSEMGTSLSSLRQHSLPNTSKDEKGVQNRVLNITAEKLQASEYLHQNHCPCNHKSSVLILPKLSPGRSSSQIVQVSEPLALSDCYTPGEIHSAELCSKISCSCLLPVEAETDSAIIGPDGLTHARNMNLRDDASVTILCPNETPIVLSKSKCMEINASVLKPSKAHVSDSWQRFAHNAEPAVMKGRNSSPGHQFSFDLGRITRSLSFKETWPAAQLNSACATFQSGPTRSEASNDIYGVQSAEVDSEVLQSNALPLREINNEIDMLPNTLSATQNNLPFDPPCTYLCPNETSYMPASANAAMKFQLLGQNATELAPGKEGHHSPSQRFNFGLGRMGRSSSLKEGLTHRISRSFSFREVSNTFAAYKSVPVRAGFPDSLDVASNSNANVQCRSRSSPLRRLLEPLLKTRATNPHPSAKTVYRATGNLNLSSKAISSNEILQDKPEALMVQAIVQLTIKNGLPIFKLAVDNGNDILVAMKKLTPSGKNDSGCIYTFYTVSEIKGKSSSWINHGRKEKGSAYIYNFVGKMKILSFRCQDFKVQNSKDQFVVRESVLYGVDARQADQGAQELMPSRELAAIINYVPIGNLCDNTDQIDNSTKSLVRCTQEGKNSSERGESDKLTGATVILPGGVHSLPNEGHPSPLIERWKSGGSCDCGGWDIGCKIRILTNDYRSCKLRKSSLSSSNLDHFALCIQGAAGDNGPVFSLAPLQTGIYSIKFSASISLLQAFSICVSVISSQKQSGFSEVNDLTEWAQDSTRVSGEEPSKIVPAPPLSHVARV